MWVCPVCHSWLNLPLHHTYGHGDPMKIDDLKERIATALTRLELTDNLINRIMFTLDQGRKCNTQQFQDWETELERIRAEDA